MGANCCSNVENDPHKQQRSKKAIRLDTETTPGEFSNEKEMSPDSSGKKLDWRKVPLTYMVDIKIADERHTLIRFKGKEMTEEQKLAEAEGLDTEDDENKWLCNGASEEEGFIGGCKSG